jgi:hypothetical protein
MKTRDENQRGQILIILAVALVALMAITALAIDGSMVLNERRQDQSTADSSALAGAGAAVQVLKDHSPQEFYCGSSLGANASVVAMLAAQNSALADGVALVQNDPNNGISVTCGTDGFRKYLDVKTIVSSDSETTFAKVISRNNVHTKVEATVRVFPKQTIAFGNALAAIGNSCGYGIGGISLVGGASVTAVNGGVFSNSCINGPSNSNFYMTGGGAVTYYGSFNFSGSVTGGPIVHSPIPLPELVIPPNPCQNPPAANLFKNVSGAGTYNPGYYNGFTAPKQSGAKFNPGLYCIKGNINAQGNGKITGYKVTFFMMDGNIDFAANSIINMTAPDCETPDASCGVPPAIRGIVIYFNPAYQRTLSFAPGNTSYFEGTILGPTTTVTLQGHADPDAIHSQIICNNYAANGNTNLTINLDGAETYQNPSSLELLK